MENLTCFNCGRPVPDEQAIVYTDPSVYVICHQCFSQTKTCAMCVERSTCEFETNPSPLPKQEQKTIRQGNMVMQTVVKGEERTRLFCQGGCKCWSEDFGCLKENGTCGNYKEVMPNAEM